MVYKIGRVLQVMGMIVLPVALAGNIARPEEITLWVMLAMAGAGVGIFTLGWLLQQAGRSG